MESGTSSSSDGGVFKWLSTEEHLTQLRNGSLLVGVGWFVVLLWLNGANTTWFHLRLIPVVLTVKVDVITGIVFFAVLGFMIPFIVLNGYARVVENETTLLSQKLREYDTMAKALKAKLDGYNKTAGDIMVPFNLKTLISKGVSDISSFQFNPAALTARPAMEMKTAA
jgi:hypothetical protein